MIEYPSISNSSKAPRLDCIAFNKLDGSSFRGKYTPKNGFNLFGTRTQLIDEITPFWGEMVTVFNDTCRAPLEKFFKQSKDYRDYREIIVFGEFFGANSFAGNHANEAHKIVIFDVLCGHKERKFVLPQQFIKDFSFIETPEVIYRGKLNDEFITKIRDSDLNEGVICKGTERSGAYRGSVWMCKIKTRAYWERLQEKFGEKSKEYWE
jgi:hypothetical protein